MPTKIETPTLRVFENFIYPEEEIYLISQIPKVEKTERKVRTGIFRYGAYIPPYRNNIVSEEIPRWLRGFSELIDYDHVTVNEYWDSQSLDYHYDSLESGEIISVLSLLGTGILSFKNKKGDMIHNVRAYPRSLIQFSNELRYDWKHSFKSDDHRYSIVFRKSNIKVNA